MKITRKGEYALKALTRIALNSERGESVTLIKEISASEAIPRKFLERILLDLKKAGFLTSKSGVGGGYSLLRPAGEISLDEVISLVDGPISPIECVGREEHRCASELQCAIYSVMLDVNEAVLGVLKNTTLQDLADKSLELQKLINQVPSYEI